MKKILILTNSSEGLYDFRGELVWELLKEYQVYISVPDTIAAEKLKEAGFQLMEALAVEVKTAYEKLSAIATMTGTKIDSTICTTGGQAKNPAWLRYKSQVVQAAFSITACADAELVGDAVLAYCGLGKFSSIQEGAQALVHQSQVFAPKESI